MRSTRISLALVIIVSLVTGAVLFGAGCAKQQSKTKISVATGGTGGVYYIYGGGLANVITKNVPNVEATAEVTSASVDNAKLIQAGKADLAYMMADVVYDAANGKGKFSDIGKISLRTLGVLYSNYTHIVVLDSSPIQKVSDLKGKKVSTGSPGSGTEVLANRILEAAGIDPAKDIKREQLGVSESAGALKDRKIDAFFWSGGLPTAAVLDLASTPGIKIRLLPQQDELKKMVEKYGPIYFNLVVPKGTYKGFDQEINVVGVANLLVVSDKMKDDLAYKLIKVMFDKKDDLVAVHAEAKNLKLESAVVGSPIDFHPGAIKFYTEKNVWKKK